MGKINVFVKLFQELLLGFVCNSEVFQTHAVMKKRLHQSVRNMSAPCLPDGFLVYFGWVVVKG